MTGIDIPIPQLQTALHQPTLKEISYLGEREFLTGIQCLSLQKSMLIQDESLLSTTTNFQIFMTVMNDKITADKKQYVLAVLRLLFPNNQVFITPRAISLGGESVIDENNFEDIQKLISQVFRP